MYGIDCDHKDLKPEGLVYNSPGHRPGYVQPFKLQPEGLLYSWRFKNIAALQAAF